MTYPLGLRLAGRRVLVVGGGTVAQRRVPTLLDAGAEVLLVAPVVTPTLEGLVTAGGLRPEARGDRPAPVDGAWVGPPPAGPPGGNPRVGAGGEGPARFLVRVA